MPFLVFSAHPNGLLWDYHGTRVELKESRKKLPIKLIYFCSRVCLESENNLVWLLAHLIELLESKRVQGQKLFLLLLRPTPQHVEWREITRLVGKGCEKEHRQLYLQTLVYIRYQSRIPTTYTTIFGGRGPPYATLEEFQAALVSTYHEFPSQKIMPPFLDCPNHSH